MNVMYERLCRDKEDRGEGGTVRVVNRMHDV